MLRIVSRGGVYLVTENTSVSGIPELPEDGKGDSRPNVDVEAYRSRSIPDEVNAVRGLESQYGPDLARAWAE